MTKKNIFVVGLDDFNLEELKQLKHSAEYNFHALCNKEELQQAEGGSFNKVLELCRTRLKEFKGSVDSIIAYWDFPAEAIAPILRKEYDMPYTTLESLEQCEHKYWSRVAQEKVIPEHVPDFCKVDPFDEKAVENISLPYPFWLKPVNSFSSYLGFKINNAEEFAEKLAVVREAINDIAEPYDELLEKVSLPYNLRDVGGRYCIAEAIIAGAMFATCGYQYQGEINIYGLVDVVRLENDSTLSRLRYPTNVSKKAEEKAIEATKKIIQSIGFENSAFHVEWMYDEESDKLWLVEINPRISQSHGELFRLVDGESDMAVPINIGLSKDPAHPAGQGKYATAAKYYWRETQDALVKSVPSQKDMEEFAQKFPDVSIHLRVNEGELLSDHVVEDSYSYCIAELYLGAQDEEALLQKIEQCKKMLPFELEYRE